MKDLVKRYPEVLLSLACCMVLSCVATAKNHTLSVSEEAKVGISADLDALQELAVKPILGPTKTLKANSGYISLGARVQVVMPNECFAYVGHRSSVTSSGELQVSFWGQQMPTDKICTNGPVNREVLLPIRTSGVEGERVALLVDRSTCGLWEVVVGSPAFTGSLTCSD